LKGFLELLARRYIAGTERGDAVEAARRLNSFGIKATIDNLGENVTSAEETSVSLSEYLSLLDLIESSGVDSAVSLKLTHLGLDVSEGLALANVERIAERAAELGNFVRIDMEGSAYTEKPLKVFKDLHERHKNVGVAVQSYLKRSRADVEELIKLEASVRLVKGAYKEDPDIAFEEKEDVDENFSFLMKELLLRGFRPAIATHDEKLIEEARAIAQGAGIPKKDVEFQMLLGIKRTLQKDLAEEGYAVRVYVPYGPNWLAYMTRRLRERRENLLFVVKNIFD
jgi:proline dehydrogenase